MKVTEENAQDIRILRLEGALSGTATHELKTKLPGQGDSGIKTILDCVGVREIDDAGLRALLAAAKSCANTGGQLVLARLPQGVEEALRDAGLLKHFMLFPIVEAAKEDLLKSLPKGWPSKSRMNLGETCL